MVTHPTTNCPVPGLCAAERTGYPVLLILWLYVMSIVLSLYMTIDIPSNSLDVCFSRAFVWKLSFVHDETCWMTTHTTSRSVSTGRVSNQWLYFVSSSHIYTTACTDIWLSSVLSFSFPSLFLLSSHQPLQQRAFLYSKYPQHLYHIVARASQNLCSKIFFEGQTTNFAVYHLHHVHFHRRRLRCYTAYDQTVKVLDLLSMPPNERLRR